MADASVLIVGAGPTGLVLALWLTKQGVRVRIIDAAREPGSTSRALAVHARTLELYEQLDLADTIVARGYTVPGFRLWLGGEEKARVAFEQIVSDLTPYGFLHIFPQDEHERLLIERLEVLGVQVERPTEFVAYTDEGDHIRGRIRGPDNVEEVVHAAFIAGCDGARSKVREGMGTAFLGGTYPQIVYVADVTGDGPAFNGDLNGELDESDFLAVFPLAHKSRVRLIGAVKPGKGQDLDKLTFDDISDQAAEQLRLKVDKVNWFSVYHVHHRVTDHFRVGRAFLLGDAAHIHTPVGGQGMNTGIGDAINLAWKMRTVLAGKAKDDLLDSFQAERRAFALRLVQTTDRFFNLAAAEGHLAEIARTRIAPLVLPQVVKFEAAREYIFRTISQLTLNYRGKGLDLGRAGSVHGGDRMPWVRIGERDNYESLRHMDWQIHIYGAADGELRSWSKEHNVCLSVFPWTDEMQKAGLRENALYLIRPDTYVAAAAQTQDVAELAGYFDQLKIQP
jgi:2-polyprenyl-6-methoxyphenol hydroxylase-like FAD-dependent oxidoreductase